MNAGPLFSSMKPQAKTLLFGAAICAIAPFFTASAFAQEPEMGLRAAADANSWLNYKSNLQRTGETKARVGGVPNLMWRHSTDIAGKANDTSPLVVGAPGQRRIYFSTARTLFCIDAQTGAQIWRSKPLSRALASPITLLPGQAEAEDLILAVTSSGQLHALRTSDGVVEWQVAAAAPVQGVAPVIINTAEGERIMLALANGRLAAFTFDGQLDPNWQLRLGSFSSAPTATPAISTDGLNLYIPTSDKKLYVVDILEAKVAYAIALRVPAYESPLLLGDEIFVASGSILSGLRKETGRSNWTYDFKSPLSAPAAQQNADGATIFVGARNGRFYCVNALDGEKLWETNLGDAITGSPTIAADMILVGTRGGVLFGLAPDDGRILWSYRLHSERLTEKKQEGETEVGKDGIEVVIDDAPIWDDDSTKTFGITSQPAVLDGQIYLLGDNAALYSFSTQPFDAAPPRVVDARLSIPNSDSRPTLQRLDLEQPLLIPGRAPVQLIVELSDIGSGVDPGSIRVFLNDQQVPPEAMRSYSDATGKVVVSLAEAADKGPSGLEDGNNSIAILGRDYRGNEMNYAVNFSVDNSIPAPKAPPKKPKEPEVQPGAATPRKN